MVVRVRMGVGGSGGRFSVGMAMVVLMLVVIVPAAAMVVIVVMIVRVGMSMSMAFFGLGFVAVVVMVVVAMAATAVFVLVGVIVGVIVGVVLRGVSRLGRVPVIVIVIVPLFVPVVMVMVVVVPAAAIVAMAMAVVVRMVMPFLGVVVAAGGFDLQGEKIEQREDTHAEARREREELELGRDLQLDAAADVEIDEKDAPHQQGDDGPAGGETAAQGSGIHGGKGRGGGLRAGVNPGSNNAHPKVTHDADDDKEGQGQADDEPTVEHREVHEHQLHVEHGAKD